MLHVGVKINFRFLFLILVIGVLGLTSCNKEEPPEVKSAPTAPTAPTALSNLRDKCNDSNDSMTWVVRGACRDALLSDFMQIQVYDVFECQPYFKRWNQESLKKAGVYIREYLEISRYAEIDKIALNERSSFAGILREQLIRVLDTTMKQAQVEYEVGDSGGIKSENALRRSSHDFSVSAQLLLRILQKTKLLGFDSSRQKIEQCVYDYAENRLIDIKRLSKSSLLYEPDYIGDISGDIDAPFYNLGSAARTKAYLEQQFHKARVLADYARPFVEFLNNTDFPNKPISNYWKKTLTQLSMKQQFADPNSQAVILDDFIINNLSIMTLNNCRDLIMKQRKYVLGMDLFSEKRNLLQQQSELHCKKEK